MPRFFVIPALLSLIPIPAAAAPPAKAKPVKVKVDRGGVLRLPAATVKALGVKPGSDGLVALEFPLSILKKPRLPKGEKSHDHTGEERPPKVWTTLRGDGSLALHNTRLIPGDERVPGPPGSTWLVRGEGGRLVLSRPR